MSSVQFKGTGGVGFVLVPLEPRGDCRHILCPGNVRERGRVVVVVGGGGVGHWAGL